MERPDDRKSVLCIDDDKAIHRLLEAQLVNSGGYKSLHAMSYEEAMVVLRESHVDLITLDINMPKSDGFQILEYLKKNEETHNIPVIFLSSLSRENLKVKALERGADDFMVKPFTGPELIARIKAVLRRSSSSKQELVGDVQGRLEEFDLFELLHMFSFSKKSGRITFPEMDGQLVVCSGAIQAVRQGSWQNKEALLRLFFFGKGLFSIQYGKQEHGESLGSIEPLLFSIAENLDELNEQIERIAPDNALLYLRGNENECKEIEIFREKLPASLVSLIGSMEGELQTNLDVVRKALQNGVISLKAR